MRISCYNKRGVWGVGARLISGAYNSKGRPNDDRHEREYEGRRTP